MKTPTDPGTHASRVDVRNIIGVSKQRARELEDHEDFPAPIDVLKDGHGRDFPIWNRGEIEEYKAQRRTAPGPVPAAQ